MPDYGKFCDISVYQPEVDYRRLAELQVGLVIRAGQNFWEDPLFDDHYRGAMAAGGAWGMYWFWQPDMPSQQQIDGFLRVWKRLPWKPKVIALDVEPIEYKKADGTWGKVYPPSVAFHSQHLWNWLQTIEWATEVRPHIYTGAYYWDAWTDEDHDWARYPLWVANWDIYSPDQIMIPRPWKTWKLWQYAGGTGRQDGIDGPVDLDYYNGDTNQMHVYFGAADGGQPPMTRAKVLTLRSNQKLAPTENPDAIILPAAGMDLWTGGHMYRYKEAAFAARCKEHAARRPVIARIELSARYWPENDVDLPALDKMGLENNVVLDEFIGALHDGPWSWSQIKAGQGRWLPFSAVEFSVTKTDWYQNQVAPGVWQEVTWATFAERIKQLQEAGWFPKVPILLFLGTWWLQFYSGRPADWQYIAKIFSNQAYQGWFDLHLAEVTQTNTTTLANLDELFAYAPGTDTFKQAPIPDGFQDRVRLRLWTQQAQRLMTVTDAAGNPSDVELSVAQGTKEGLHKFLKFSAGTPPPPVQPGELDDIKLRLTKVEERLADLIEILHSA